jgi:hypothetical protein
MRGKDSLCFRSALPHDDVAFFPILLLGSLHPLLSDVDLKRPKVIHDLRNPQCARFVDCTTLSVVGSGRASLASSEEVYSRPSAISSERKWEVWRRKKEELVRGISVEGEFKWLSQRFNVEDEVEQGEGEARYPCMVVWSFYRSGWLSIGRLSNDRQNMTMKQSQLHHSSETS